MYAVLRVNGPLVDPGAWSGLSGQLGGSDGYTFTQEQVDVGNTILSVGRSMGATDLQMRAAFAAANIESRFRNLSYGDSDSLGVFQQRPSQGWGTAAQVQDPSYAARKFFEAAMKVNASTPGQLAQKVQRSAFPARYDADIARSDALLARLKGNVVPVGDTKAIGTGAGIAIGSTAALALLAAVVFLAD